MPNDKIRQIQLGSKLFDIEPADIDKYIKSDMGDKATTIKTSNEIEIVSLQDLNNFSLVRACNDNSVLLSAQYVDEEEGNTYSSEFSVLPEGFMATCLGNGGSLKNYWLLTEDDAQLLTMGSSNNSLVIKSYVDNYHDSTKLNISGGTMTGTLQVNAPIFGYNYTNNHNAAAFLFDKPGSNYTGIGCHETSDMIWFGACTMAGAWVDSYKQKWNFNGSIYEDNVKLSDKYLNSDSNIDQSQLKWTGKNIDGGLTVDGQLMLWSGANKLTFIDAAAIYEEYSTNAGSTWTSYDLSDNDRKALVSEVTGSSLPIGRKSGSEPITTDSRTRITFTCATTQNTYLYTNPKKLLINVSTAGNLYVLIETRTGDNMLSDGPWTIYTNSGKNPDGMYHIAGWSGWNDIPLILGTLGGSTSQTSNNWQLRLTFIPTTVHASYPTTCYLYNIKLYGENDWDIRNNMARNGRLYSVDINQNAFFPGNLYVRNNVKVAEDNAVVHNSGNENVAGLKNFTDAIKTKKIRGDDDGSTYYHAIDLGYSGHDKVDFYEYGGEFTFWKCTSSSASGATELLKITDSDVTYKGVSIRGQKGDKGDTGPQGPQGIQGPKGERGPVGAVGSITTTGSGNAITAITLNSDNTITATKGKSFLETTNNGTVFGNSGYGFISIPTDTTHNTNRICFGYDGEIGDYTYGYLGLDSDGLRLRSQGDLHIDGYNNVYLESADGDIYATNNNIIASGLTANNLLKSNLNFESPDVCNEYYNIVTCSTAGSTIAKSITISGFNLVKGCKIHVRFNNAHTSTSMATLNVNGTGAKYIYWECGRITNSFPIQSGYSWKPYKTYTLQYNGSAWYIINHDVTLMLSFNDSSSRTFSVAVPLKSTDSYILTSTTLTSVSTTFNALFATWPGRSYDCLMQSGSYSYYGKLLNKTTGSSTLTSATFYYVNSTATSGTITWSVLTVSLSTSTSSLSTNIFPC